MRLLIIRVVALLALLAGVNYVTWRWLASVNWEYWWIGVPLVIAETYSLVDTFFFGLTVWRLRERPTPPEPRDGTVDVFITTYNEPVDLVMATARAAKRIRYPHTTWILDDGNRDEMRRAAEAEGIGWLTRSDDWTDKPRHAKAGNLNNALFQTEGEFLLILDADQIPDPAILNRTLGYFSDDEIALVQTPQYFGNVDEADPLGSQAPLFYGPIQQGKDGWNAAFFCGSNAILRREALMQLGIVGYVREAERAVEQALRTGRRVLDRAVKQARDDAATRHALTVVKEGVDEAQRMLVTGATIGEVTYRVQSAIDRASRDRVSSDIESMNADLVALRDMPIGVDDDLGELVVDETALEALATREWTPLGAIESVQALIRSVDVGRGDEAQPIMPLATVSVTEDMATAMQLHALGWKSVYHHEVLATGLAPEDLATMLQQRLRWAQGTLQVLLKDNPLVKKGLSWGQRLMYFSTMWSYLSGFTAVVYLTAPVLYLCFGVLPVQAWSAEFFSRFLPYFALNQIMFWFVGRGVKTWRGQQYSLALFPVWIKACVSAAANVWFKRPLGFVVTPKTRSTQFRPPWRLIWPQLTAIIALVIAVIVGIGRVIVGTGDGLGTLVNTAWVAYDLVVMSIIVQAALYRGPVLTTATSSAARPEEERK